MKYLKLTDQPQAVMSHHGKSFYFASKVFSKEMMKKVSYLYSFCRYVDDCADELTLNQARVEVEKIRSCLNKKNNAADLNQLVERLESYGVAREDLNVLVDGASFDISDQKIETKEDLLEYCFKVAGVVGLMLCPLIKVRDVKRAAPFAVDLGVGMQLTNICRDILEDAQNSRNYLPQQDLQEKGLSLSDLARQGAAPQKLKELTEQYLYLADLHYKSALRGLAYIPFRARLAILLASQIYRAIGVKIKREGFEVLKKRTYLNKTEKILVSLKSCVYFFTPGFWFTLKHNNPFHEKVAHLYQSSQEDVFK